MGIDTNRGWTEIGDHQSEWGIEIEFLRSVGHDEPLFVDPILRPKKSNQTQGGFVRPMHVLEDQHGPVVLEDVEPPG